MNVVFLSYISHFSSIISLMLSVNPYYSLKFKAEISLSVLFTEVLALRTPLTYSRYSVHIVCAKSLQSCLTLCYPVDCSLPGPSDHGILQARILEWVVMPSSGDLPVPGTKPSSPLSPTLAGGFLPLSHEGSLLTY